MSILLVLDNPKDWPLNIEGVEVISARRYLTDPEFSERKPRRVFNLCRSYRYQTLGYYVSLLASARGHRALPDISTIQDLKLPELVRVAGEEVEEVVQQALKGEQAGTFTLSIYFGQNVEEEYSALALAVFNQFPAPFLRATFERKDGRWRLDSVKTIAASDIPPEHFLDVLNFATHYFNRPHRRPRQEPARHDLAILYNPSEPNPPSDERAIRKFVKAAESMGFDADIITRDDYGRLAEFDALFIRDTTAVNSHTFRFARRAAAEGLVVIDDPGSIVRCSNKVYLAELLARHRIPTPQTMILHRDNWQTAPEALGLPLVLKQPDSAFSLGVVKIKTREEFDREVDRLFRVSDLLIAQAYMPTPFDWRIGVLDKEPLFACKYFMAGGHWQVHDKDKSGDQAFGDTETWPISAVPQDVVKTAVRAANLVGDGLYGVDMKEVDGKAYVIEINDNPNIDSGCEDKILGDEAYARVMRTILQRLESRGH
jgi:glutathione synthase/RimK-type ligase-like ATP-grasp enzyme